MDQLINPEQQLSLSKLKQAELVPAEILYKHGIFETKQKVYQHYSEEIISCIGDKQENMSFISEESKRQLVAHNYKTIHIGLCMIGIHGMHRSELGCKVHVTLIDTRFSDLQRAVIGTMEVDMTKNRELIYFTPDFIIPVPDFCNHICLLIKTKGYESMVAGKNLMITKALVGRLSNRSTYNFKLQIDNVMTHLGTQGVKAIMGKKFSVKELEGEEWTIELPNNEVRIPEEAKTWKNKDGSLSTRYSGYTAKRLIEEEEEDEILTEPARHSTLFMILDQEDDDEFIEPTEVLSIFGTGICIFDEEFNEELDYNAESSTKNNFINPWGRNTRTTLKDTSEFEQSVVGKETIKDLDEYAEEKEYLRMLASLDMEEEYYYLPRKKTPTERIAMVDSTANSSITVPQTRVTGVPTFGPPNPNNTRPSISQEVRENFPERSTTSRTTGKVLRYDSMPTLPSANTLSGSILQLGTSIYLWEEILRRWESNTITHCASKQFGDHIEKVLYIENLLGETAKLYFQSWRTAFPAEFQELTITADDTSNITTQIRQILLGHDEYRGYTEMQNQAILDLERLSITSMKDIEIYSNQYLSIAAKTGTVFLSKETSDKYFRKLPPPFNTKLQKMWEEKYPTITVGVAPRIYFTYQVLQELCKQNEISRQARDFSFCRNIAVPGYYSANPKPRKYLRRATTYRNHPHQNHIRRFKTRKPGNIKCKCFICGDEGHYANNCHNETVNKERLAVYQQLELLPEWDVVSMDENENPNDSDICSFSDDEADSQEREEIIMMMEVFDWNQQRANKKVPTEILECKHDWEIHGEVRPLQNKCYFCPIKTVQHARAKCFLCNIVLCSFCIKKKFGIEIPIGIAPKQKPKSDLRVLVSEQSKHILDLEDELLIHKKTDEGIQSENPKEKEKSREETLEETILKIEERAEKPRRMASVTNNLLNMVVTLEIEGKKYNIQAILDTGASKCCITPNALPEKCYEHSAEYTIFGVNSVQKTTKRLKNGYIILNSEKYPMPFTYALPLTIGDQTQLIIGMNFVYGFKGGIRIEQGTLTFYKKVEVIQTTPISKDLACKAVFQEQEELEYSEVKYIQDMCCYNIGKITDFESEIIPILKELEKTQVIGDNPKKYWCESKILCKIEIINPDLTIQDKPIIPTPIMNEEYKKHIEELLKMKLIRPSTSRHRSAAFVVNKHSEEIRGKSRMVYNYKRLNDNTHKDQYSLPNIDFLIQKIKDKAIYSKFDLKSGFHQVAMHEDSIPWTAFICPQGHFEWLAMPFGLKNAPSVFQRKMDNIFQKFERFIIVYIDDILVFSDNITEHVQHLKVFFAECKKEGLILSKTKMKIGVAKIEFLGLEIGEGKIKLQEHIVKKILEYPEQELETLKGLQRFLGILNYARNYIPNLGKHTGPLYNKCSINGERKFNKQDWNSIKEIRKCITKLPDLDLPPPDAYIIIETDGSLTGWGGILKWKPKRGDPISSEKIARYCSGKYKTAISAIDAEIMACIYCLDKFRIFILDKTEYTLRTDCHAIVSFFQTANSNKLSRNRWVNFMDYMVKTGTEVHIEHIKGKDNYGADKLSRIISTNDILILQDYDSFSSKMSLCPSYRKNWVGHFPEEIQQKIYRMAQTTIQWELFQTQLKLKLIWETDYPLPGVTIVQDKSEIGGLLTTIVNYDEIQDNTLVKEFYEHGAIRRMILKEKQPNFLPPRTHEEQEVWEIFSSYPSHLHGDNNFIQRYIKISPWEHGLDKLIDPFDLERISQIEYYHKELFYTPEYYFGIQENKLQKILDQKHITIWKEEIEMAESPFNEYPEVDDTED